MKFVRTQFLHLAESSAMPPRHGIADEIHLALHNRAEGKPCRSEA